jgi:hypothetical protein
LPSQDFRFVSCPFHLFLISSACSKQLLQLLFLCQHNLQIIIPILNTREARLSPTRPQALKDSSSLTRFDKAIAEPSLMQWCGFIDKLQLKALGQLVFCCMLCLFQECIVLAILLLIIQKAVLLKEIMRDALPACYAQVLLRCQSPRPPPWRKPSIPSS